MCLSVDFLVLINGQLGKRFKPTRGLRQGDPLSPFMFLIVIDVLSRLIHGAVEEGFIDAIKISSTGPTLSHLLFTDDTLIFLRASIGNCQNRCNFSMPIAVLQDRMLVCKNHLFSLKLTPCWFSC